MLFLSLLSVTDYFTVHSYMYKGYFFFKSKNYLQIGFDLRIANSWGTNFTVKTYFLLVTQGFPCRSPLSQNATNSRKWRQNFKSGEFEWRQLISDARCQIGWKRSCSYV